MENLRKIIESEHLLNYIYDIIYDKETEYINEDKDVVTVSDNSLIISKDDYDNEFYTDLYIYDNKGLFMRITDCTVDSLVPGEYLYNQELLSTLKSKIDILKDAEYIILCN